MIEADEPGNAGCIHDYDIFNALLLAKDRGDEFITRALFTDALHSHVTLPY